MFRAKALRLELLEGPSLETSKFSLYFSGIVASLPTKACSSILYL